MAAAASSSLSPLVVGLVTVSLVSVGLSVYLLLRFQNKAQKEIHELASRMAQIEREYLRIKPEVDEVKSALEDRVDYSTMEKKLRELITFVGERVRQKK